MTDPYFQMRLFDGNPVEQFAVRFSPYDIDEADVTAFRDGDVLVMVMVASVEGATIKPLANGDRKRINNAKVHNMRVVRDAEMRENLVEVFHLTEAEDQLPLGLTLPESIRPARPVVADDNLGDDELDEDESVPPELNEVLPRDATPAEGYGRVRDPALASFLDEPMASQPIRGERVDPERRLA